MGNLKRSSLPAVCLLAMVSIGFVLCWTYMNMVERRRAANEGGSISRHVARPENSESTTHSAPVRAASNLEHWWCSGRGDPKQPISISDFHSVVSINSQNLLEEKYFLTAVLLVRIFGHDVGKATTRDLVHWLQYLSWAGVEHVYVYDAYLYHNESQRGAVRCFIENGFVTYVDWSHRAVPNIRTRDQATQIPAYNDCWQQFGHHYVWQLVMDIDEYPYSSTDESPGFLRRIVKKIFFQHKKGVKPIARIILQNFMYMGKFLDNKENPFWIKQLRRRTKQPFGHSTKYIYLSRGALVLKVHEVYIDSRFGSLSPNVELLRMNHYHGDRHDVIGNSKIKNTTKVDFGMNTSLSALQVCHKGCPLGCC